MAPFSMSVCHSEVFDSSTRCWSVGSLLLGGISLDVFFCKWLATKASHVGSSCHCSMRSETSWTDNTSNGWIYLDWQGLSPWTRGWWLFSIFTRWPSFLIWSFLTGLCLISFHPSLYHSGDNFCKQFHNIILEHGWRSEECCRTWLTSNSSLMGPCVKCSD